MFTWQQIQSHEKVNIASCKREFSVEHKKKLSLAKLGKPRHGNPEHWKHTEESKKKVSKSKVGNSPAWNKGKSGYMGANKTSFKKGDVRHGANHHSWKGGITPINEKIRKSEEIKHWRKSVFARDNFTCQRCGAVGVKIQADHELPFALYHELRTEVLNGQTLCVDCHRKKKSSDKIIFNENFHVFSMV